MKRLFRRVVEQLSSPARQVALSVAFGQTILLAITPVLALLYPIEVIGKYQVVYSVAIVAQVVATGGIEYILPGVTNESAARRAYRRGLIFLAAFAALAATVAIAAWLVLGADPAELAASSAAVAIAFGSTALDNARLLRRGDRKALVRRNYLAGLVSAAIQMLAFLIAPTLFVLVAGLVLGRLASLAIRDSLPTADPMGNSSASSPAPDSPGRSSSVEWIVGVVLSTATLQAPVLFTGQFLGPVAAAQIALAIRLVSAPASLLGGGIAQGFIFATAQMLREKPDAVPEYIRRTQVRLARVSIAIGIATVVLGPLAVLLLFSDEWTVAAVVVAILALPYAVQLVNRATTPLYPMLNATRSLLVIQIVRFFLSAVLMISALLIAPDSVYLLAVSIAVAALAFQVFFFFFTARLVGAKSD